MNVLKTGVKREITMPNAQIYRDTIINYFVMETRRIELAKGAAA